MAAALQVTLQYSFYVSFLVRTTVADRRPGGQPGGEKCAGRGEMTNACPRGTDDARQETQVRDSGGRRIALKIMPRPALQNDPFSRTVGGTSGRRTLPNTRLVAATRQRRGGEAVATAAATATAVVEVAERYQRLVPVPVHEPGRVPSTGNSGKVTRGYKHLQYISGRGSLLWSAREKR